jgi:hypothetical protein
VDLTARRAYAEVLGLFLVFFGASATFAVFAFAGRVEPEVPDGSWAVYLPAVVDELAMTGLAIAAVLVLVRLHKGDAADVGFTVRRDPTSGRPRW